MKNTLGLSTENRQSIAHDLSVLLASEVILKFKTLNAHWNVEGESFMSAHLFFEKLDDELNDIIDLTAERIRMIGHFAPARLKEYLELSIIPDSDISENNNRAFVQELLADHEAIVYWLKGKLKGDSALNSDYGSANLLSNLLDQHEKSIWFLRSHLVK